MSRAVRFTLPLVALGALSCDPRTFDDLEDSAWVQLAERNDSQAAGDWAFVVIPMPVDTGKQGVRFVLSLATPSPGLAVVTFDEHGKLTDQKGQNTIKGGGGPLSPLNDTGNLAALAPFSSTQFVVGEPARPFTALMDVGLMSGSQLLPDNLADRSEAGTSIAVGHVDSPYTATDIVVTGVLSLTVIPGGDPAKARYCKMKRPNVAKSPPVATQTLQVAKLDGATHDVIIVGGRTLVGDKPMIQIFDAKDVVDGQNCPETGITLTTAQTAPIAVAVGDLNGNGKLDIVATSIADEMVAGSKNVVNYCPDVTASGAGSCTEIPTMGDDGSSNQHGSTLLIANIDKDAGNELLVGDSAASPSNVATAGQVLVYKIKTCDSAMATQVQRGPACLITKLYDPSPSKNDQFGRAMTAAPFPTPTSATNVLGIVEKNKLWVYFRVFSDAPDPRVK